MTIEDAKNQRSDINVQGTIEEKVKQEQSILNMEKHKFVIHTWLMNLVE